MSKARGLCGCFALVVHEQIRGLVSMIFLGRFCRRLLEWKILFNLTIRYPRSAIELKSLNTWGEFPQFYDKLLVVLFGNPIRATPDSRTDDRVCHFPLASDDTTGCFGGVAIAFGRSPL